MFCDKCGWQVNTSDSFCTHCGAPIAKTVPLNAQKQTAPQPERRATQAAKTAAKTAKKAQAKMSVGGIVAIVLSALVVLCAACALLVYFDVVSIPFVEDLMEDAGLIAPKSAAYDRDDDGSDELKKAAKPKKSIGEKAVGNTAGLLPQGTQKVRYLMDLSQAEWFAEEVFGAAEAQNCRYYELPAEDEFLILIQHTDEDGENRFFLSEGRSLRLEEMYEDDDGELTEFFELSPTGQTYQSAILDEYGKMDGYYVPGDEEANVYLACDGDVAALAMMPEDYDGVRVYEFVRGADGLPLCTRLYEEYPLDLSAARKDEISQRYVQTGYLWQDGFLQEESMAEGWLSDDNTGALSAIAEYSFGYDPYGRCTEICQKAVNGGEECRLSCTYNDDGLLSQIVLYRGSSVTEGYTIYYPMIGTSYVEQTMAAAVEERPLRVAVSADYRPFIYQDDYGTVCGFDADLIDMILCDYLYRQYEWIVVDFDSLFSTLECGDADLAISAITLTSERAGYLDASEPYFSCYEGGEWIEYAIFLPQGSELTSPVNDALAKMTAGGYLGDLIDKWELDELDDDADDDKYILPDSDKRYIETWELEELSWRELTLARNEIYARHGRQFSTAEIREYFTAQSWYNGTIAPQNFSDSVLSEIERSNAKTILDYEKACWGGSYY